MEKEFLLMAKIVAHIPVSVIAVSLDGIVKYINENTTTNLGYEPSDIKKIAICELFNEQENHDGWEKIKKILIAQHFYRGETSLVNRSKQISIHNTTGFCVMDENNCIQDFVLVFQDVTNEKFITQELERKNLEMARMNAELIRSNQELKRVSELKTKFLSIASHELKTPLTSIKGYSEIIIDNMKDKVDKTIYRMIDSINKAADRLNTVINNMLDVTRIEQKRLRLKPENMNLVDAVNECIEEISQFVFKRAIKIITSFESNLPVFYGDKMRIHQVFTNLLSNALKFSPDKSEIEIKVFLEQEDRFHCIVSDHGIGIEKKELEHVFKPFYEIADTRHHSTDAYKFMGSGTGLGLSIVKGIVERHGGVIWAESPGTAPGLFLGSNFHFLLPVRPRIQWDDDETMMTKMRSKLQVPVSSDGTTSAVDKRKPLILIIDDDREAIEVTKMVLCQKFDITTAENGEEGLKSAFTQKPNLILLDLYLPGMDGSLICRILRSQEETKFIPISFFTAANQYDEIENCYASGADDYILKPFTTKEILEKVTRLIEKNFLPE